jgi:dUTP pyrophosphatase
MDNNEIEDYIKKLKEMERALSNDEPEDLDFVTELDKILSTLNHEIQTDFEQKNNEINVKIKKLTSTAVIPTYSKDGDAGMDLTICTIISETTTDITYGFGIAMEIPKGYVGLVFPRSSIRKYDLSLTNSVGVIDSGYRGEIQATFKKTSDNPTTYEVGDRGAQIMIIPYPKIKFIETDELNNTERGVGGFGSTGQ